MLSEFETPVLKDILDYQRSIVVQFSFMKNKVDSDLYLKILTGDLSSIDTDML